MYRPNGPMHTKEGDDEDKQARRTTWPTSESLRKPQDEDEQHQYGHRDLCDVVVDRLTKRRSRGEPRPLMPSASTTGADAGLCRVRPDDAVTETHIPRRTPAKNATVMTMNRTSATAGSFRLELSSKGEAKSPAGRGPRPAGRPKRQPRGVALWWCRCPGAGHEHEASEGARPPSTTGHGHAFGGSPNPPP